MNTTGLGAGLQGFVQGAMDAIKIFMTYQQMQNDSEYKQKLFQLSQDEFAHKQNIDNQNAELARQELQMKQEISNATLQELMSKQKDKDEIRNILEQYGNEVPVQADTAQEKIANLKAPHYLELIKNNSVLGVDNSAMSDSAPDTGVGTSFGPRATKTTTKSLQDVYKDLLKNGHLDAAEKVAKLGGFDSEMQKALMQLAWKEKEKEGDRQHAFDIEIFKQALKDKSDMNKMAIKQATTGEQQKKTGLSSTAIKDLSEIDSLLQLANTIKSNYNPKYVGLLDSPIGTVRGWFGAIDPKEAEFRSSVAALNSKVTNMLSGAAVSKEEMARLQKFLPNVSDSEPVFLAKLNSFINNLSTQKNNLLDYYSNSTPNQTANPTNRPPLGVLLNQQQGGRK